MPNVKLSARAALPASAPILYFDLGSPYAYLAFARCERVLGVAPGLQPVLLGAIFKRRGFGSWSQTELRAMRTREIELRAERYGLSAFRWPAGWPGNGLEAMRYAAWAQREGALFDFARAVFREEFEAGEDIADPEMLRRAALAAGLDPQEILRGAQTPEIKQALRSATEAAWDAGVRGVPTLRVGDSIFFGDDQLELAALSLREPQ